MRSREQAPPLSMSPVESAGEPAVQDAALVEPREVVPSLALRWSGATGATQLQVVPSTSRATHPGLTFGGQTDASGALRRISAVGRVVILPRVGVAPKPLRLRHPGFVSPTVLVVASVAAPRRRHDVPVIRLHRRRASPMATSKLQQKLTGGVMRSYKFVGPVVLTRGDQENVDAYRPVP